MILRRTIFSNIIRAPKGWQIMGSIHVQILPGILIHAISLSRIELTADK